jgi:hypothetical protein
LQAGTYSVKPLEQDLVIRAGEEHPQVGDEWFTFKTTISAEEARHARDGSSHIWFYGRIVYQTLFGRECETRFCWRYSGIAKKFEQCGREDEGLNRRT